MTIGKICNQKVDTIYENSTLQEAAKLMADKNVGFLVATGDDESAPVGSITDRDIVVKGIARGYALNDTKVSEIMCKDLLTVEETQGIQEIIEKMVEKKVRRAPIVSNNRISGIVTLDDLFPILAKELNTLAEIPRDQAS